MCSLYLLCRKCHPYHVYVALNFTVIVFVTRYRTFNLIFNLILFENTLSLVQYFLKIPSPWFNLVNIRH